MEVLTFQNFPKGIFQMQNQLSREDFMIICGDFGLIWEDCEEERNWLKWLEDRPWTTLWIDGNHENFDRLKSFSIEKWNGGLIQKITPIFFIYAVGKCFKSKDTAFLQWAAQRVMTKYAVKKVCPGGGKSFQQRQKFNVPELRWSV